MGTNRGRGGQWKSPHVATQSRNSSTDSQPGHQLCPKACLSGNKLSGRVRPEWRTSNSSSDGTIQEPLCLDWHRLIHSRESPPDGRAVKALEQRPWLRWSARVINPPATVTSSQIDRIFTNQTRAITLRVRVFARDRRLCTGPAHGAVQLGQLATLGPLTAADDVRVVIALPRCLRVSPSEAESN